MCYCGSSFYSKGVHTLYTEKRPEGQQSNYLLLISGTDAEGRQAQKVAWLLPALFCVAGCHGSTALQYLLIVLAWSTTSPPRGYGQADYTLSSRPTIPSFSHM